MHYGYFGTLGISRPLTDAEMEEAYEILGKDEDADIIEADGKNLEIHSTDYGSLEEEFVELSKWIKSKGITLSPTSCIKFDGTEEGALYPNNDGILESHDSYEYGIWNAADEDLIKELEKRGIWQKQRHLIQIGAEYILNDLGSAEPDYVRGVLDGIGADDNDLREMGLECLIPEA